MTDGEKKVQVDGFGCLIAVIALFGVLTIAGLSDIHKSLKKIEENTAPRTEAATK